MITARKPHGLAIALVLMAVIALGVLCTTATMLLRSSGHFAEILEQSAQDQLDAGSAAETVIAAMNTKGVAALDEKRAEFSLERLNATGNSAAFRIRTGTASLEIRAVKRGAWWAISSYGILQ